MPATPPPAPPTPDTVETPDAPTPETGTTFRIGDRVVVDEMTGTVDLVVVDGEVPGVEDPLAATAEDPVLRIVFDDESVHAIPSSEVQREEGGEQPVEDVEAEVKAIVLTRGKQSWPGADVTTLTADEWAYARHDAFMAKAAGRDTPASYVGDDDLLERLASRREIKAAKDQPDYSGGVALMLLLAPDVADEVALPDGLPADGLHVTLGYWGASPDVALAVGDDLAALADDLAQKSPVIEMAAGGMARFKGGPDGDPFIILPDSPALEGMRAAVRAWSEETGNTLPDDHGYTPHVTLAYLDPEEGLPFDRPTVDTLRFDRIVAAVGGREHVVAFG